MGGEGLYLDECARNFRKTSRKKCCTFGHFSLRRGFLATDLGYDKVRFAVPRHALRLYVPALWPEADQGEELLRTEGGWVIGCLRPTGANRHR